MDATERALQKARREGWQKGVDWCLGREPDTRHMHERAALNIAFPLPPEPVRVELSTGAWLYEPHLSPDHPWREDPDPTKKNAGGWQSPFRKYDRAPATAEDFEKCAAAIRKFHAQEGK